MSGLRDLVGFAEMKFLEAVPAGFVTVRLGPLVALGREDFLHVVRPNGFSKAGPSSSICFIGKLFGEAELLVVAKKFQDSTDHHRQHPSLD